MRSCVRSRGATRIAAAARGPRADRRLGMIKQISTDYGHQQGVEMTTYATAEHHRRISATSATIFSSGWARARSARASGANVHLSRLGEQLDVAALRSPTYPALAAAAGVAGGRSARGARMVVRAYSSLSLSSGGGEARTSSTRSSRSERSSTSTRCRGSRRCSRPASPPAIRRTRADHDPSSSILRRHMTPVADLAQQVGNLQMHALGHPALPIEKIRAISPRTRTTDQARSRGAEAVVQQQSS